MLATAGALLPKGGKVSGYTGKVATIAYLGMEPFSVFGHLQTLAVGQGLTVRSWARPPILFEKCNEWLKDTENRLQNAIYRLNSCVAAGAILTTEMPFQDMVSYRNKAQSFSQKIESLLSDRQLLGSAGWTDQLIHGNVNLATTYADVMATANSILEHTGAIGPCLSNQGPCHTGHHGTEKPPDEWLLKSFIKTPPDPAVLNWIKNSSSN